MTKLIEGSRFPTLNKGHTSIYCKIGNQTSQVALQSKLEEHVRSTAHQKCLNANFDKRKAFLAEKEKIAQPFVEAFIATNIPLRKLDDLVLRRKLSEVDINLITSTTARARMIKTIRKEKTIQFLNF